MCCNRSLHSKKLLRKILIFHSNFEKLQRKILIFHSNFRLVLTAVETPACTDSPPCRTSHWRHDRPRLEKSAPRRAKRPKWIQFSLPWSTYSCLQKIEFLIFKQNLHYYKRNMHILNRKVLCLRTRVHAYIWKYIFYMLKFMETHLGSLFRQIISCNLL